MKRSSRGKLTRGTAYEFAGDTLFDAVGRAVSAAECLPRKELYESWEVASRIRRRVRGRPVLELAAGHGLVSWLLQLFDPQTPSARCVDRQSPANAVRLEAALTERWPRLAGRVRWGEADLSRVTASPDELVVGVHACGTLTDRVLEIAIQARAAVAVLPCCHDGARSVQRTGGLEAWMPVGMAVDAVRALRLQAAHYQVYLRTIPEEITPQNRLILGIPLAVADDAPQARGSERIGEDLFDSPLG